MCGMTISCNTHLVEKENIFGLTYFVSAAASQRNPSPEVKSQPFSGLDGEFSQAGLRVPVGGQLETEMAPT